jgi:hypothetical protein
VRAARAPPSVHRLLHSHGVLIDGALVPAAHVPGAVRAPVADGTLVHYVHLRLPRPQDMLVADGVVCESLR